MKSKIWWIILLAAVLFGGQSAWADDFYVVAAGPTAVGTKIASLPYTISSSGFYYLTGNLTISGSNEAITVNADNVTIDLMGFSLTNTAPIGNQSGIFMDGRSNVEVRNGSVSGFYIGINEKSSGSKHRAINIRATSNTNGVWFSGADHLIKNCSGSNNNGYGLTINGAGMITGCVASNNLMVGIALKGPGSVIDNTATYNTYNFLFGFPGPTAILVDRNSAFGGEGSYVINDGATGVVITSNNVP